MASRTHTQKGVKILGSTGGLVLDIVTRTHTAAAPAGPDPNNGHMSSSGGTPVFLPPIGTFDDHLNVTNLESEAPSTGPAGGKAARLQKTSGNVVIPTDPSAQWYGRKYQKTFGGPGVKL